MNLRDNSMAAKTTMATHAQVILRYWRHEAAQRNPMILLGKVNPETVGETHMEVYRAQMQLATDPRQNMQELFEQFNSEDNPLSAPETQQMIRANGLHTSMSVGDLVELEFNGAKETWVCAGFGWKKIK